MIATKWQIEEEIQMDTGRVMCKVLIGTSDKKNVYEYMFKDILEKIQDGTYEYNVFTKAIPAVCVFYNDMIIPHNASVLKIKEECQKEIGNVPTKLFIRALPHKQAGGNEYAISTLLDGKYNAEFVRLAIKDMFSQIKEAS